MGSKFLLPALAAVAGTAPTYCAELKRDRQAADTTLADGLGLLDYLINARSSAVVDITAAALETSDQLGLSDQQATTLLDTLQALLQLCIDGGSRKEAAELLKARLLKACSAAPGPASGALAPDQIAGAAQLLAGTLLQHWLLYQYLFTQEQVHIEQKEELMVEAPMPPPPLETALPEDAWKERLAAQAAAAAAAAAAAVAAEVAAREAAEAAEAAAQREAEAAARKEYLERKPKTLEEAVAKLVANRVEEEKVRLTAELAARHEALLARVAQLEAAAAASAAAAAATTARPSTGSGTSRRSTTSAGRKPPL